MISFHLGTHDVQNAIFNTQDEPVTVTIDYIENTEALGALLALMYLDQDGNIVCSQSIYAAIRRSEDAFPLPMGDPAMTNSYMGLAYDIERNGLEDKAYPAVRRHIRNIKSEFNNKIILYDNYAHNYAGIRSSYEYVSSCTVTYSEGTASVSCEDSTSSVSGHQVILLQPNGSNLIVETIRSGRQVSLPLPRGRYCIMELPMEDNELVYSELRYSSVFIAEDETVAFATSENTPTTRSNSAGSSISCKNNIN